MFLRVSERFSVMPMFSIHSSLDELLLLLLPDGQRQHNEEATQAQQCFFRDRTMRDSKGSPCVPYTNPAVNSTSCFCRETSCGKVSRNFAGFSSGA